jgi:anti-anti-sigma regulatory factor
VQNATDAAPHVHFAVLGERRNGIDRLSLLGSLDSSTIRLLEDEVAGVAHADGALVLDLHNLDAVDIGAVRALQEMARWAVAEGWLLFIVRSRESVREAFVREGAADLLCADVSAVLSPGDGGWAPISLPPLPGQRVNTKRLRMVEKRP